MSRRFNHRALTDAERAARRQADRETPGFAGAFGMGAAGFEPATSRV